VTPHRGVKTKQHPESYPTVGYLKANLTTNRKEPNYRMVGSNWLYIRNVLTEQGSKDTDSMQATLAQISPPPLTGEMPSRIWVKYWDGCETAGYQESRHFPRER